MNQGNNELAEVNRFSNLDLEVSVELGRKELTLQEARSLKKDECIELDKLAGEAMEVFINGRPFGEGEMIVIADQMAVRLTRILEVD